MNNPVRFRLPVIAALCLICLIPPALAAAAPDYSITYTITVTDDGSALWKIEYRTPLITEEDMTTFENYSRNLNSMYLPELRDLMQRSVSQAAMGTSRDMAVNNFTGNALVQTSPTGKYGVITYSFSWTNFARKSGNELSIGDAFAGGLYLSRDNSLLIRYPQEYSVTSLSPAPDQTGDGLIWYGLRSFGPGQPSVRLTTGTFPLLPVLVGGIIALVLAIAGLILYRRGRSVPDEGVTITEPDETGEPAPVLTKEDLETLEERIIQLLVSHNEEMFQSEIVRVLGLPKSTVSTTLNALHQQGIIQKVRKGRENLIRLVKKP